MASIYNRLIEIGVILLIVLTPIYYGSIDLAAVTIIEIVILFMLLVWAFEMVVQGNFVLRRTPLDIVILLFCVYSVISTLLFSKYTYASYMGLSFVLCISALYFIITNHVRSISQLKRLFVVIVLVGSINALLHLAGNTAGLFGVSVGTMLNVGNHFAGYMVIIIPLAVAASFVVKDTGKRVLLIFSSILMAAATAFSLVTGAMLALLLSLILLALFFVRSEGIRKQALILGGVILFSILIIFWIGYEPVLEELMSLTNLKTGNPGARLSLWRSSLAIFADNPFTGTGLSTFDYVYPIYRLPDIRGRAVYAHSDWLQLLAELGLPGFMIFLSGSLVFFLLVLKKVPSTKLNGNWAKGLVIGGLSSVGVGLAHAWVDFNFHIPAIALLFAVIVALTILASSGYASGAAAVRNNGGDGADARKSALPEWEVRIPLSFRVTGFICMLLFIGVSAVLILRPYIAHTYYQNGMKSERELSWDEAIREYRSAIDFSHTCADYPHALGDVYAKRVSLARGTERQGKWHKLALESYNQAIKRCPVNAAHYLALGNLSEVVGNAENAKIAYEKAISLDQNNAFYHGAYATFCLKQGGIQKAITEYRRSLELYPSAFYLILDECYTISVSSDRTRDTGTFLNIAEKICPEDTESHVTLAQFCADKGWYDVAFSEYWRAIELAPERIELWEQSSKLLMEQGMFGEAASLWQEFLGSHPRSAQAHVQLAEVYIRQKLLDDAIRQYLASAKIEPDNLHYLVRVGDLYIQQGRPADALELWQTVIKRNPREASACYSLGKYYEDQGDWGNALDFLQRAIVAAPKNMEYRLYLARSYYRKGLLYEAIQEWERALDLRPENVSIHLRLAEVYQQIGRQDKAREHNQQFAEVQPENMETTVDTENSQAASSE
jgi:tetratricopeptide (TPR) repeat protein